MALITKICEECKEEVRQVNPMFYTTVHQELEVIYKNIVMMPITSQKLVHLRMYCRNCDFSSTIQVISLN